MKHIVIEYCICILIAVGLCFGLHYVEKFSTKLAGPVVQKGSKK